MASGIRVGKHNVKKKHLRNAAIATLGAMFLKNFLGKKKGSSPLEDIDHQTQPYNPGQQEGNPTITPETEDLNKAQRDSTYVAPDYEGESGEIKSEDGMTTLGYELKDPSMLFGKDSPIQHPLTGEIYRRGPDGYLNTEATIMDQLHSLEGNPLIPILEEHPSTHMEGLGIDPRSQVGNPNELLREYYTRQRAKRLKAGN